MPVLYIHSSTGAVTAPPLTIITYMGTIYIKDLRLHAFHGVLPQEREVGNDYVVNLSVDYPVETAAQSDKVEDTMSYADAAAIIQREMGTPSCLIENVAWRIAHAVLDTFTSAASVTVDIMKIAPPMQADCAGAGVRITLDGCKL